MQIKIVNILFLIIITAESYGQSRTSDGGFILFHGIVLDSDTQTPVSGASYRINGNEPGSGGMDGKFSFYVSRRDTVVFTSLGYQPLTMFISDTLAGREYVAGLYMLTDTINIGAVIIVPRLGNLKTEIMLMKPETNQELSNAKDNINISVYQGLNNRSSLGDPYTNYELLKQKQRIEAKEKGGIPSDRMVGISPLIIIPAAYLLMNGIPQKPSPPNPRVSDKELEQIRKMHNNLIYKTKE